MSENHTKPLKSGRLAGCAALLTIEQAEMVFVSMNSSAGRVLVFQSTSLTA